MHFINKIQLFILLLFTFSIASCETEEPNIDDPIEDPIENIKTPSLVINEVCGKTNAEWIEILNTSDSDSIDISGLLVVYKNNLNQLSTLYKVPNNTSLAAGEYKVFDKANSTLSGSFAIDKTLTLYLISSKRDTLDVFDRDTAIGINKVHPQSASYARIPNGSDTWIISYTPTKGTENKQSDIEESKTNNGIWVRGENFPDLNFQSLAEYGINNVFVNETTISNMGETSFRNRVAEAKAENVKIHIWFQCFHKNGAWVNPINTSTQQFNQAYFDELIARAKQYVSFGDVAGIHLDYVRYPGTAFNYSYSTQVTGRKAITEFCRQLSVAVKTLDPNVKISAALMNETSSNAYYYGQDTRAMSPYIDIFIPMVYRYSYGGSGTVDKGSSWVSNTTRWFVNEVKMAGEDAEVWAGIMTYKPLAANDAQIQNLSAAQLETDCRLSIKNGTGTATEATGVVLFRYGIVNYFDMRSIYF